MSDPIGFRLPHICLPRPGIDLRKWAVIACDQYTSEPEYWREVEREVGDAPSTLHLIFPEVHLGQPDAPQRIARIQQTMHRYLAEGLFVEREGAVYVERTVGGRTRRGLMLELDLEHYDYAATSTSLIRPTEGTMVERLAPRIEVRKGAPLELPHILVLIDDPARTVIEPLGNASAALPRLYDTELMGGGGHVAGHAVDAAHGARAVQALQALASPDVFAARYSVSAAAPPMLFAMGDGNHSLATAKSIWQRAKGTVGMDHPSRYALVEVVNIHDEALAFEPIHRLLIGVHGDVRAALATTFGPRVTCTDVASAQAMHARITSAQGERHLAGLVGPGARFTAVEVAQPADSLAVGTFQAFVDAFIEQGGAKDVDYVHGDDTLVRLAQQPGHAGLHLAGLGKAELMSHVVHNGPTPRKTFSMGMAHEKRFYVEARRIVPR